MAGAFPYVVRKMLDLGMVTEFKTKIELARCWTCSRSTSGSQGRLRLQYWSEKPVRDNVVSELKSNRAQGRPGGPSRRWRDTSEWDTPGLYYADLTLGERTITVKLLVREYKRDSGTHVRCLYTTDLSLSEEEIEEAWRMRWEIEELHRDVKALGLEDSSFSVDPKSPP